MGSPLPTERPPRGHAYLALDSHDSLPASTAPASADHAPLTASLPYDYDYEANSRRNDAGVGFARRGGAGAAVSSALAAASRLRGTRQKLLWLTAAVSLVYLFHSINSPIDDGHAWHPHLGDESSPLPEMKQPIDFYDPPPPPATSTSSPVDEPASPEELDLSRFAQPRRKVRPAAPDPWSDAGPAFPGRAWLSPERFGSDALGWHGMRDPSPSPSPTMEEQDAPRALSYTRPPPARYLAKAFEYAAAVAKREWNAREMGRGANWDRRTGRVVQVARKWLKWEGRQGWVPTLARDKGYKVGDLGTGTAGEREMRRIQATDDEVERREGSVEFAARERERVERRDWVKRAFLHAWEGYKEHAWGHDELAPVSNLWSDNYNGWGATLVDNLDTLLIMNLSHEYNLARQHVAAIDFTYLVPSSTRFFPASPRLPPLAALDVVPDPTVDYDDLPDPDAAAPPDEWINARLHAATSPFSPTTVPLFETTIRYLGGLISAYDLSGGDPVMLARARELGDWLLPSLNTDWGLAVPRYRLGSNPDGGPNGRAVLAEVGSLGMELIRLSQITHDETYYIAAQRAMDTLDTRFSKAGPVSSSGGKIRGRLGTLLPSHVNPMTPAQLQGEYTFGGLADSYYEYMIKQAQLTSFTNPQFDRMYRDAIDSAYRYLVKPVESVPGRERDGMVTIGTMNWGAYRHELQHLTAFAGGMLALGAQLLDRPKDLETAKNFTEACVWVYESSATGIGGEQTTFYDKGDPTRFVAVTEPDGTTAQHPRGAPAGVRTANRKQIGRPETIESVVYLWRVTGDRYWQDRGWQMFTSWVEHAITESGFAAVADVNVVPVRHDDSMESFVTAETLKYYYLLFSPRDFMSLDDYVFNTEAHPFLIPKAPSPSSSPPRPLWTGPEPELEPAPSFVAQGGEGTAVQLWARVLQAAKLAATVRRSTDAKGGGWFGALGKAKDKNKAKAPAVEVEPVKARKPIRPSEEELERARGTGEGNGRAGARGGGAGTEEDRGAKGNGAWKARGGGGKGLGGGAPPPFLG
ncbi:hypothetical protein JCM11491_002740 [Sporobolomyces phaffii]